MENRSHQRFKYILKHFYISIEIGREIWEICKITTKEIVPYPLKKHLAKKLLDAHAKQINVR
jgi:hypothetical protein